MYNEEDLTAKLIIIYEELVTAINTVETVKDANVQGFDVLGIRLSIIKDLIASILNSD